jgi:hypothetical protein
MHGIKYRGSILNIDVNKTFIAISAVKVSNHSKLVISGAEFGHMNMRLNTPIFIKRGAAFIKLEAESDKTNFSEAMKPEIFVFTLVFFSTVNYFSHSVRI